MLPQSLREKLDARDESLLPELVFNCILQGTGVSVIIPSMLQAKHLQNNLRAVERCRFSPGELQLVRESLALVSAPFAR